MTATESRLKESPELPAYEPLQDVHGKLTAWGDPAFEKLWRGWTTGFARFHQDLEFEHFLVGTSTAVGALYTGTAEIGLFGREMRKLERTSWKRVFSHQPVGFSIATGAFDTFAKTVAVAVLVNSDNPVTSLTFQQLDAIYSSDRKQGGSTPITTWGQLGLTGEWADKPIKIYGLDPDTGTAQHFQIRVLQGGRWSPLAQLPPGAPTQMYAGSGGHAADALVTALEQDPYAIGLAGFRNRTAKIKAVALSEYDGPFVEGTRETTATRAYPLSRSVYAFVREAEDTTWVPMVREFLRFILSREGQEVVAQEGDYLPLPAGHVHQELTRLTDISSAT